MGCSILVYRGSSGAPSGGSDEAASRLARLVDRLPRSDSCTSSCRCTRPSCSRSARRPAVPRRTRTSSSRPAFFGASATRSIVGFITIFVSSGSDRADGVLGPAPGAAGATVRRVRDAPAVRHPADRPRLRAASAPTASRRCRSPTRDIGSSALLIAAYVVLSFPYMYRAVDTASSDRHPEPRPRPPRAWAPAGHDHRPDHPAEPSGGAPVRRVPDPRYRRRRVHDRELPGPAGIRAVPVAAAGPRPTSQPPSRSSASA